MARDEGNAPGSANEGGQGNSDDGWNSDGSLPDDLQIKTPADSSEAVPMKGKGEQKKEEPQQEPEEGQEPEPAEGVGETEGEQEEPEEAEVSDTKRSLTEMEGRLSQTEKMLQFYQKGYNELMARAKGAPAQPPIGEQAAQGKPTPQGQPDADLQAPPPEWKTSEEVVQYFDKRNQSVIRREINQVVQQYVGEIDRSFSRVNQAIHSFVDRSVKPQLKDFDEVVKNVNNELFILDPTGQNVVDVRNRALLQYFQSQPIPILAMYDYGVSRQAPQKIKNAASEATKKTVQKIANRPKAPKQIKGGASSEQVGELDWDTPKDKVEQILGKKRLI
jgi:hypothetical protein